MYRYRCTVCRTTSPVVRTRVEMHAARDRHRTQFHGGHVPDGEQLLRRRRGPPRGDWRLKAALITLMALPLLEWIAHHTR